MKSRHVKFVFLLFPILLFSFSCDVRQDSKTQTKQDYAIVNIGDAKITAQVADNPALWTKGLSGRKNLDKNSGMLFVFPESQIRNFWMKDMLFPIDIIWIDGEKVVGVEQNLPPEPGGPLTSYVSNLPARYVLEVSAGYVAGNAIKPGDSVTIEY